MKPSKHFTLTALSIDPRLINLLDEAGIDRIGIDIERQGKRERQASILGSRISDHELVDINIVKNARQKAAIFIRLNPLHSGSRDELDQALSLGATVVMLPYFITASEVRNFVRLVHNRAEIVLLLETAQALEQLPSILEIPGLGEVMVGLNDLHLSLGLKNPFEVISKGYLELPAKQVRESGISFGFGGLARVLDTALPIPADLIYSQYSRVGADAAWLSRSFFNKADMNIGLEVSHLRKRLDFWKKQSKQMLDANHEELCRHVHHLTCKEMV